MLRCFGPGCDGRQIDPAEGRIPDGATWIDLLEPTEDERALVELVTGHELPTRDELVEIEPSSRLYDEKGAIFLTLSVLYGIDEKRPQSDPVGFVLVGDRLVSVREVDPKPLRAFAGKMADPERMRDALCTLLALIDAITDRLADQLEVASEEVETISERIFTAPRTRTERSPELRLEALIIRIGRVQQLLARVRETSNSTGRLVNFLAGRARVKAHEDAAAEVQSLTGDLRAIDELSNFLAEQLTFLLDAALGLIAVQQNVVMKIFSVVAVVLMPPTLIAAIYGMNFRFMPELAWPYGYPLALFAMLASAVLPYTYARKKGWL